MSEEQERQGKKGEALRCGFSTGTAAVAAAMAALRMLLTRNRPNAVAPRLPSGMYLAVPIADAKGDSGVASATVMKDGGDDPDITNRASISANVKIIASRHKGQQGVYLTAGPGVGVVKKAGLPVPPGEPAINPVPRLMFADNLLREMRAAKPDRIRSQVRVRTQHGKQPTVFVPFESSLSGDLSRLSLDVTVEVEGGEALARHTLNPRLGIVGGISILGTTGIVKPYSHEAYEKTISSALSVAASNGCKTAVLSTGGKSERFARALLNREPDEAFVLIADFFAFSVREARRFGFDRIVHSVFFGKAVKMSQGHEYTHAHKAVMDLETLASTAKESGCDEALCCELAAANTARHALDILTARGETEVTRAVAEKALAQSVQFAGEDAGVRLLLFDYNGSLLSDVSR